MRFSTVISVFYAYFDDKHMSLFYHGLRMQNKDDSCFRGYFIEYQNGDPSRPILSKREWSNNEFNFDTVMSAMVSLFVVSTFEGWPG